MAAAQISAIVMASLDEILALAFSWCELNSRYARWLPACLD
jgi:hypothetical protein